MPPPKHPPPLPRKQISRPISFDEPEKSAPLSPTKSGEDICSSPPPVSPKTWTVKKSPEGNGVFREKIQMLDQCFKDKGELPLLPPKPNRLQLDDESLDAESLSNFFEESTPWKTLSNELQLGRVPEKVVIEVKAEHLCKAFNSYISMTSGCQGELQEKIDELGCIADNLDKVSKGTKIAGITGGATTVAGGVAAAAGVILSPFTLGASLALTAVGVGVAAAGGVTGASAAIANKVNCNQDQKKIEKIFTDYESLSKGIQEKLVYVHEGIEQLRQYGVIMLERTKVKSERASKVLEFFGQGGPCAKVLEANSKPSGMIEGFALGMDMYFIKGKDGTKVKKGFESKLAKKLRSLAVDLQERLDEFIEMKELFEKYC
ncbi:apolipoprotein L3-like isoform X1 [Oreochromis niloticus]|uniref:Apolipoprotein L3-like n=2 Tax=Oreochromis niloticus TaxID=8128 RepID=I3K5S1_ORENI|nr:apolipoprotein L3-like isoform X1 [Oreochromis niloticus]